MSANDTAKVAAAGKPSPAAERALAEAAARRAERDRIANDPAQDGPKEINGRGGLDPTRYSDWEVNGLTSDF